MKKKLLILMIIFNIIYLFLYYLNYSYYKDNNVPIIDITLKNVSLEEINNNSKEMKYSNNSIMVDKKYYFDNVTIKGRGNYTWSLNKKPYQISFDDKVNILGLKAKKFILLANHTDPSLLKNDFSYSVAKAIDLNYSFTGVFVDLYVNRKYIGNYYLTPKVSSVVKDNIDNAIIVELDNSYYQDEQDVFESSIFNDHLVLKESDDLDSFFLFENKYNNMEEAIDDGDYNRLCELIDIESFVKYYIISEFSENIDSVKSSLFFYMDGENDKIHIGPLWDFDLGYDKDLSFPIKENTICNDERCTVLFYKLLQIKEFDDLVHKIWNDLGRNVYKKEIKLLEKKIKNLEKTGNYNNYYWDKNNYYNSTRTLLKWIKNRYKRFNSYMEEKNENY